MGTEQTSGSGLKKYSNSNLIGSDCKAIYALQCTDENNEEISHKLLEPNSWERYQKKQID